MSKGKKKRGKGKPSLTSLSYFLLTPRERRISVDLIGRIGKEKEGEEKRSSSL